MARFVVEQVPLKLAAELGGWVEDNPADSKALTDRSFAQFDPAVVLDNWLAGRVMHMPQTSQSMPKEIILKVLS